MKDTFSIRYNYPKEKFPIAFQECAPRVLRVALPMLARECGMHPTQILDVICNLLLIRSSASNRSQEAASEEINLIFEECKWYRVYDISEALWTFLFKRWPNMAEHFQIRLNCFFEEHGIGWKMSDGIVAYRGSEPFVESVKAATEMLLCTGRNTASMEIHEALVDISRRPVPDVTGAIQHSMAALECVARDIVGDSNLTLGRLIPSLSLTPPLDKAIEKLWGYSSERARHIREGRSSSVAEAELVVSIACAVCSFLSKSKLP